MKAYIATSFANRQNDEPIINVIVATLNHLQIQSLVFVDTYSFAATHEKEMMDTAMKAIDDCDILIANGSHKAVGVGIEAGYAKAKGKLVIYLRSNLSDHSTTLSGISDQTIVYQNLDELALSLQDELQKFKTKSNLH